MVVSLGLALVRTRKLHDEADRRESAETALRQAQRMEAIGQLTGGVAHDFNNLLTIVTGGVQRLMRRKRDADDARYLEMIAGAAKRGENLTRQLLAFSRRQALAPHVIDLSQRIPEFRDLLNPSLRGDIELIIEVPRTPCPVKVDPAELELAILNIAVNARDAMPSGGRLSIRVRRVMLEHGPEDLSGAFAEIAMTDTGRGIAAEVLPRVFDPGAPSRSRAHRDGARRSCCIYRSAAKSRARNCARANCISPNMQAERCCSSRTMTRWPRCAVPISTSSGLRSSTPRPPRTRSPCSTETSRLS
jgi:two-component system NtrC family sensor kinase